MGHIHECVHDHFAHIEDICNIASKITSHADNTEIHLTEDEKNLLKEIRDKQDESTEGSDIDSIKIALGNKANKIDVPTKVSQLINDKEYISNIPDFYVTEEELKLKGYATEDELTQKILNNIQQGGIELDDYATKNYVSQVTNSVQASITTNANDISLIKDRLDNLVGITTLYNYYTKSEIDSIIANLGEIGSGSGTGITNATVSCTTLPAGSNATASVTLSGSTLHFTFGIPAGPKGDTGAQGPQGPAGTPGSSTPGSDALTKVFVAIIYRESETKPQTPTGGSYNFDTQTLTVPSGWQSTPIGGEHSWYSMRAFYSNDTTTEWSEPAPTETGNVDITAINLDILADKILASANFIDIVASKVSLNAEQLDVIAQRLSTTADFISLVSGRIDVSTLDLNVVASKLAVNTEFAKLVAGNVEVSIDDDTINIIAEKIKTSGNIEANSLTAGNLSQTGTIYIGPTDSDFPTIMFTEPDGDTPVVIGDVDNADQGTINVWIASDGSGFVAGGNIRWDSNGNVTILGDTIGTTGNGTIGTGPGTGEMDVVMKNTGDLQQDMNSGILKITDQFNTNEHDDRSPVTLVGCQLQDITYGILEIKNTNSNRVTNSIKFGNPDIRNYESQPYVSGHDSRYGDWTAYNGTIDIGGTTLRVINGIITNLTV